MHSALAPGGAFSALPVPVMAQRLSGVGVPGHHARAAVGPGGTSLGLRSRNSDGCARRGMGSSHVPDRTSRQSAKRADGVPANRGAASTGRTRARGDRRRRRRLSLSSPPRRLRRRRHRTRTGDAEEGDVLRQCEERVGWIGGATAPSGHNGATPACLSSSRLAALGGDPTWMGRFWARLSSMSSGAKIGTATAIDPRRSARSAMRRLLDFGLEWRDD